MNTETIKYNQAESVAKIIDDAQHIVVIQADNPDADSMASSLALEQILGEMGKQVTLYCGIDITQYLRFIDGWDRVTKELPSKFDAAILVDCSSISLLEQLQKTNQIGALRTRPFVMIDHHDVENDVTINATTILDTMAVSTGEVIYNLSSQLDWKVDAPAANYLATSIMADSLGLTSEQTTARTIHTLANIVDLGADLAKLDAKRREHSGKTPEIVTYKGKLLQRIEYLCDDQLALVTIPWEEIQTYSPLYNPSILALEELRMVKDIRLAVALKLYPDGKITGKLRCNYGTTIAGKVAEHFGGGGHPSAAGFKTNAWKLDELKKELIKVTTEALA